MAAQPAVGSNMAWYSDPDFAAARNRTIPPGGATTYGKILSSPDFKRESI